MSSRYRAYKTVMMGIVSVSNRVHENSELQYILPCLRNKI